MMNIDGDKEALLVPCSGWYQFERNTGNFSRSQNELTALLGGPPLGQSRNINGQQCDVVSLILDPGCWESTVFVDAP